VIGPQRVLGDVDGLLRHLLGFDQLALEPELLRDQIQGANVRGMFDVGAFPQRQCAVQWRS